MKVLKFKPPTWNRPPDDAADIRRMRRVLHERGYTAPDETLYSAWAQVSDDLCAGWLLLPDLDDQLFQELMRYLEEVEDGS